MREHARYRLVFIVTSEMTATTFLRGYLAELQQGGLEVTVVSASTGRLEALARREGVRSVSVAMSREPHLGRDLLALVKLVKLVLRTRPHVVVTATPKASLLGMMAAKFVRVRVRIYQVWGLRSETERGLRGFALRTLEKLTLRTATHIVANSESLAEEVRRLAAGRSVQVLGAGSSHGVDVEFFNRKSGIPTLPSEVQRALAGGGLVVGTVGRVSRDKGIRDLLLAMEQLAEHHQLSLLVVGPSEDADTEAQLHAARKALNVVRVGEVRDTRPYFRAMDIHVLPSLREGFPNVVLEASALEVPSITTTATGARDSVVDGVTGILVRPRSPRELAAAISLLSSDQGLRRRMGSAARVRVEQNFRNSDVWRMQSQYIRTVLGQQDRRV